MIDFLTYNELYTQVGEYIQDTSSARQSQIQDAINREYSKVVADIDWPQLLKVTTTTLPNAATMYLPRDVDSIKLVSDTTRRINLDGTDTHQLYRQFASQIGNSAVPVDYADDGDHGKKADVASAETLNFVSSSAADTTQLVRIWGTDSAGAEQTEQITLNGTTDVPTTLTYSDILRVSSNDTTRAGKVTVTGVTSSTEYVDILPNEVTIRYKRIRISGNSSNAIVLFYKKRVQRLTYDDDIPELPISMYLFEIVVAKMYQLQRKWQPAQFHQAEAEKLKLDALATVESRGQTSRQSAPSRKNKLSSGPVIIVNPGS
jgi:hypothetical protein